jgi:N-carbamoyl-L-amino-acid hydrolase
MESTLKLKDLTVNSERLRQRVIDLSSIGKHSNGGIYRMGLTQEDLEARNWLMEQCSAAGLSVHMDGALNVIARLDGAAGDKPTVILGSHTDTVPNAGALDGALGVVTALECLHRVTEENIKLDHPVELVSFSDEEGRFGGMFGSRSFAGNMSPGYLDAARDLDGIFLKESMESLGYEPMRALEAARNPSDIKCYLELHIEQGPVLDANKLAIGIVTDITGLFKWQVSLRGTANHAGTTPMHMRNDAFMGLADFAHEIPRIIDENGSEYSRMTIGKVQLLPGSPNTVPGEVIFSLDVRDISEQTMQELQVSSRKVLSAIARKNQLKFDFEELSWISPVACDQHIIQSLTSNARQLGYPHIQMPSGAAHDAQMIASIAPVGMLFVPSKGGISHSSHEWTDWRDIEAGANLMLQTLLDIC